MDCTQFNENLTANFVAPGRPYEEPKYHGQGKLQELDDTVVYPTAAGTPCFTDKNGISDHPCLRPDAIAAATCSYPSWILGQPSPYPLPIETDPTDSFLPELSSQMQADHYVGYYPQRPANIDNYMSGQYIDAHTGPARQVISTNAVILASERRRLHPHRFFCHHCSRGFTAKHNYNRHMAAHSDTRPYLCHCGSTFTTKSDLKRHLGRSKQHLGYACLPSFVAPDMLQGAGVWLAGSVIQAQAQDNNAI